MPSKKTGNTYCIYMSPEHYYGQKGKHMMIQENGIMTAKHSRLQEKVPSSVACFGPPPRSFPVRPPLFPSFRPFSLKFKVEKYPENAR